VNLVVRGAGRPSHSVLPPDSGASLSAAGAEARPGRASAPRADPPSFVAGAPPDAGASRTLAIDTSRAGAGPVASTLPLGDVPVLTSLHERSRRFPRAGPQSGLQAAHSITMPPPVAVHAAMTAGAHLPLALSRERSESGAAAPAPGAGGEPSVARPAGLAGAPPARVDEEPVASRFGPMPPHAMRSSGPVAGPLDDGLVRPSLTAEAYRPVALGSERSQSRGAAAASRAAGAMSLARPAPLVETRPAGADEESPASKVAPVSPHATQSRAPVAEPPGDIAVTPGSTTAVLWPAAVSRAIPSPHPAVRASDPPRPAVVVVPRRTFGPTPPSPPEEIARPDSHTALAVTPARAPVANQSSNPGPALIHLVTPHPGLPPALVVTRRPDADREEDAVHVHIGTLEIRTVSPREPPRSAPAPTPTPVGFDGYDALRTYAASGRG
jgi:hypothetical protein